MKKLVVAVRNCSNAPTKSFYAVVDPFGTISWERFQRQEGKLRIFVKMAASLL